MSEMLRKSDGNREQNSNREHGGRKSILQELAGLTVVVVAPGDDQTPLLIRELQRLRGRIERLDENLRSMRTVERAKAILMETRRMPENEAYAFIRRQAMDRRVSASSVAGAIVDSFELLGYSDRR